MVVAVTTLAAVVTIVTIGTVVVAVEVGQAADVLTTVIHTLAEFKVMLEL